MITFTVYCLNVKCFHTFCFYFFAKWNIYLNKVRIVVWSFIFFILSLSSRPVHVLFVRSVVCSSIIFFFVLSVPFFLNSFFSCFYRNRSPVIDCGAVAADSSFVLPRSFSFLPGLVDLPEFCLRSPSVLYRNDFPSFFLALFPDTWQVAFEISV